MGVESMNYCIHYGNIGYILKTNIFIILTPVFFLYKGTNLIIFGDKLELRLSQLLGSHCPTHHTNFTMEWVFGAHEYSLACMQ